MHLNRIVWQVVPLLLGMTVCASAATPDLIVWPDTLNPVIVGRDYPVSSCDVVEGCALPGPRRYLIFTTETRNIGDADIVLGDPSRNTNFVFAPCHGHYHFSDFADSLQRTLRDEHDVTVATGGKEALGLLLAPGAAFDVVFCDLSMPEMSGPECFEELRKRRPDLAARIVFLTGGAHTGDGQAFLRSVPNERLEKPFDPERLKERARAGVKARDD